MEMIIIKLITGEELIGSTESLSNDDILNLENPMVILYGQNETGDITTRMFPFSMCSSEKLFTFILSILYINLTQIIKL